MKACCDLGKFLCPFFFFLNGYVIHIEEKLMWIR